MLSCTCRLHVPPAVPKTVTCAETEPRSGQLGHTLQPALMCHLTSRNTISVPHDHWKLGLAVPVGREVPAGLASQPEVLPGGRTSGALAGPNDVVVQTLLIQQQ